MRCGWHTHGLLILPLLCLSACGSPQEPAGEVAKALGAESDTPAVELPQDQDGGPADDSAMPITISHRTTRIVEPLRDDGYPDYVAALDRHQSQGATPWNCWKSAPASTAPGAQPAR